MGILAFDASSCVQRQEFLERDIWIGPVYCSGFTRSVEQMIGLIIPLAFVLFELVMYQFVFKRWTRKVNLSLDRHMASITSLDRPFGEWDGVVAIMRFPDGRKRAIWIFAMILIIFFFALTIYIAPVRFQEPQWLNAAGAALFMCLVGSAPWILLIEPYGNIRVITTNGILKRSPWTGAAFVRWDEIRSVRWIPFLDSFFVKSDKGLFAINHVYENLEKFAEGVLKNLPESRWIHAERKLREAQRGPFQP
jgi:hypothetical protein